jgi:hypothetical protein
MSKYPPLQSLLAAPLMKVGMWLDGGGDGLWTHRLGLSLSLLACVALVPMFYAAARTLEAGPRLAAVATALFGVTNPVWPYSKRFFSEPLTAALSFGAFLGALSYVKAGRKLPLVLGLACMAVLPPQQHDPAARPGPGAGGPVPQRAPRRAIAGLGRSGARGALLVAGSFYLRLRAADEHRLPATSPSGSGCTRVLRPAALAGAQRVPLRPADDPVGGGPARALAALQARGHRGGHRLRGHGAAGRQLVVLVGRRVLGPAAGAAGAAHRLAGRRRGARRAQALEGRAGPFRRALRALRAGHRLQLQARLRPLLLDGPRRPRRAQGLVSLALLSRVRSRHHFRDTRGTCRAPS